MTIKIYGYGWVGKAMHKLFPDASIQDPQQGIISTIDSDVAFICVPTPLKGNQLDTSIVRDIIRESKENLIIIRSTVNPGDTDEFARMYDKEVCFVPEYLGETVGHPLNDQKQFLVIGGRPENRRKVIELYQKAVNANIKIRQVSNTEAELIKLSENRAIAFKVMQCQELYDACQAAGVDYYTIRDAVYGDDPRFNLWFTFVYPENRGFNSSKCLVKDVPAWAYWAEINGADTDITRLLIKKSNDFRRNSIV